MIPLIDHLISAVSRRRRRRMVNWSSCSLLLLCILTTSSSLDSGSCSTGVMSNLLVWKTRAPCLPYLASKTPSDPKRPPTQGRLHTPHAPSFCGMGGKRPISLQLILAAVHIAGNSSVWGRHIQSIRWVLEAGSTESDENDEFRGKTETFRGCKKTSLGVVCCRNPTVNLHYKALTRSDSFPRGLAWLSMPKDQHFTPASVNLIVSCAPHGP